MKTYLTLIILCLTVAVGAQDKYAQGMQKAFDLWQDNKSTEAVALFERIAQAEKDNWLPSYLSLIHI